ncbi:ABC transporter permease [Cellulomonas sp. P5_C5]
MRTFALKRAGAAILLLVVLSFVLVLLQQISPTDPARAYVGANASQEVVAAKREQLGLDDPLAVRYVDFLQSAVTGDLGRSLRTRNDVTHDLGTYLPATIELVLAAFLVALVLATLFAVSGALQWRGTGAVRGGLLVLGAAPPFVLAIVGIVFFYGRLGWLPGNGQGASDSPGPTGMLVIDAALHGDGPLLTEALRHLVLPATVLAIIPAIAIGRIFRTSLEATLRADHIRTARSKGLDEGHVLRQHVFRNAAGPAVSMAGLQLGFMFAGVVVVEQVFGWPGIGNYLAASIPVADFPAIAGVTLVLGTIYVLSNTAVDLIQAAADPRITA